MDYRGGDHLTADQIAYGRLVIGQPVGAGFVYGL